MSDHDELLRPAPEAATEAATSAGAENVEAVAEEQVLGAQASEENQQSQSVSEVPARERHVENEQPQQAAAPEATAPGGTAQRRRKRKQRFRSGGSTSSGLGASTSVSQGTEAASIDPAQPEAEASVATKPERLARVSDTTELFGVSGRAGPERLSSAPVRKTGGGTFQLWTGRPATASSLRSSSLAMTSERPPRPRTAGAAESRRHSYRGSKRGLSEQTHRQQSIDEVDRDDRSTEGVEPEASPPLTDGKRSNDLDLSKYEGKEDLISMSGLELPTNDADLSMLTGELLSEHEDYAQDGAGKQLLHRPGQEGTYGRLQALARELQDEEGEDEPEYLENFAASVREEMLLVGTMSLDAIQEEEQRLRRKQLAIEQLECNKHQKRQVEMAARESDARKNVHKELVNKRRRLLEKEKHLSQKGSLQQGNLHRAYQRAEVQLQQVLEKRKGEVQTLYGDLQIADDGQYTGNQQRRWKVEWRRTPQPIEVRLKCLRGVKDKLPSGRYAILVSLFDRLGGHLLRWSNLSGQQWGGATLPLQHMGRFHDVELTVDQSVFTVCPSRHEVKPGMVLVFELFILRGAVVPCDRVVAWGTFPISDADFNIIEGRYRCAMLRGERDVNIDRHGRIEELIANDLDTWLCNLYFEIVKLPRYLAGQKEYEVELQFTSGLLGFPDRLGDTQPAVDGNDPLVNSQEDIVAALKGEGGEETVSLPSVSSNRQLLANKKSRRSCSQLSQGSVRPGTAARPATSVHFSRKLLEMQGGSDSSSDDEDADIFSGFTEDMDEPGLYYKVHTKTAVDERTRHLHTMVPKTPLLKARKEKKKLSRREELQMHTVAVKAPFSTKPHTEQKAGKKWSYVRRQLLSEVGLSQWRSREFWGVLLMFAIVFWIRLYAHYIGQWIFLQTLLIPVNKFDFLWISVDLNYQSSLLYTRQEVGVVVLGPISNILVFSVFVAVCYGWLRLAGSFPHILSRFILAYGLETALDPLLILAVDCTYGRYDEGSGQTPVGDAFKLYYHFVRVEGNGVAGVFLTTFAYVFTTCISLAILYIYFLRLHMNGRMLDVYHRLHGAEDDFLLPYDLELSNEELDWVCRKAEQWRGQEGERRKVAVYDYVWEEADDEETLLLDGEETDSPMPKKRSVKEMTTHVSIHTLHLDGLRELHRHFLRLPDGAIVEVIGEMGLVGMETRIQNTLRPLTDHVGGSQMDRMLATPFTPVPTADRKISRASADYMPVQRRFSHDPNSPESRRQPPSVVEITNVERASASSSVFVDVPAETSLLQ